MKSRIRWTNWRALSQVIVDYDCTLLECHVNLDLEGFEDTGEDGEPTGIKIPYIVTISEDNGQVLSIRRNFKEDDDLKKKIQYFRTLQVFARFWVLRPWFDPHYWWFVSHGHGGATSVD